ncbi:MAG: carnitine-CoA ligase [Pseudonocardiales bacterium]|nr:carnitine-CoA ligase [Pseudonocardiales bacterium]
MNTVVVAPVALLPPLRERTVDGLWQRALRAVPDHAFLVTDEGEFTYSEAETHIAGVARMLRAGGVAPGVHVAVLLDNGAEYVWLLLAIARIGAVGVPVHAEARGALTRHFFASTDCTHAVLGAAHAPGVAAVLDVPLTGTVWIVGDGDPGPAIATDRRPYVELPEGATPGPAPQARFRDTYLLMFTSGTSGTSGPSKAGVVSQAQPVTHALKIAEACGWAADERFYTCLPLSHANAQCHSLLPAIGLGATLVVGRRFSVRRYWSDVHRHDATAISLLGSMLQLLTKKEPTAEERDNRVSTVLVVPFPADVAELDERYDARFATLYGLTECAPVSITRPGEGYDRPTGVAGRVLRDHNDVIIVDNDDIEVPRGTVGEILVRRHDPFVTVQRYYGRERETWDDFRNLWFHTGDFGHLDEDDYLYFAGRKSDSLRRRGENVSIQELEDVLHAFDGVLEAAVIAVPSDLGEMSEDDIAVFYTLRGGARLSERDLDELAVANLPRYMVPRYLRIVEDLPRAPTSKIRKDELRRDAAADLAAFFDAETHRTRNRGRDV